MSKIMGKCKLCILIHLVFMIKCLSTANNMGNSQRE